jgi:hypothetical protein
VAGFIALSLDNNIFFVLNFVMKNKSIKVNGIDVNYKETKGNDEFISLTDMAKFKNPNETSLVISHWLSTRYTVEYLGIWEKVNNPNFNTTEFSSIKNEAGSHGYVLTTKNWVEKTNAIGIYSNAGRYGGTYAHRDIAFEFATWLSPEFKFWIVKEFQRLKAEEQKQLAWSAKRELARINYHIQTDAIKENLILPKLTPWQKSFVYADEADLLNVVMFGKTAGEWRKQNPDKDGNIRDYADLHELLVLANLETHNASYIDEKMPQAERLEKLRGIAERELAVLRRHDMNAPLLLDTDNNK